MKKILILVTSLCSLSIFAQADMNQQIQEIMKARADMLRSLLNDSTLDNFDNFDSRFDDLVKKLEQNSLSGVPSMDMGTVVGEYDWKETDKERILVLKIKQIKDKPLDIKIEKGQIKLKGDVESVEESPKKGKRISKVHFERTFSIPEDVDQSTPEFENKGGEFLIKFKKLRPQTKGKERAPLNQDSKDITV